MMVFSRRYRSRGDTSPVSFRLNVHDDVPMMQPRSTHVTCFRSKKPRRRKEAVPPPSNYRMTHEAGLVMEGGRSNHGKDVEERRTNYNLWNGLMELGSQ